ncbi:hypothetical protein ACHAXS_009998 [Conticribra weissflogii]
MTRLVPPPLFLPASLSLIHFIQPVHSFFSPHPYFFSSSPTATTIPSWTTRSGSLQSATCRPPPSLRPLRRLRVAAAATMPSNGSTEDEPNRATNIKVAVIGGGAAGLASARACLRANGRFPPSSSSSTQSELGHGPLEVTVFEKRTSFGGIWRYDDDADDRAGVAKNRPMYRNLRTNLPKELMAFREFPWILKDDAPEVVTNGGDVSNVRVHDPPPPSYVTHRQVADYLDQYARHFGIGERVRFGCHVTQLTVLTEDEPKETEETGVPSTPSVDARWPSISLEWTTNADERVRGDDDADPDRPRRRTHRETFHHVLVCNGHYSLPSFPPIPGLDHFRGRVLHAIEYDDPLDFAGQTVVCIGARASGADIAKEIGGVAAAVFLSDSGCERLETYGREERKNVVKRVPRTSWIDDEGGVHFSSSSLPSSSSSSSCSSGGSAQNEREWVANNVDALIFCSGYDYDFPFINDKSNLELSFPPGERRVQPLYEQLWHAKYPSVSFVGLPHSVVPFPLFELQANAVVSQILMRSSSSSSSSSSSPLTEKKKEGSNEEAAVPLPPPSERMEQARLDAASGGPESPGRVQDTHFLGSHQWDYCRNMAKMGGVYDESMEKYIATNKALYDRSGKERKEMLPGGKDKYRETRFQRDDENQTYRIIYSEMEEEKSIVS